MTGATKSGAVVTLADGTVLPDCRPDLLSVGDLLARGWSIFPLKFKSKRPAVRSWLEYQKRMLTVDELERLSHTQSHFGGFGAQARPDRTAESAAGTRRARQGREAQGAGRRTAAVSCCRTTASERDHRCNRDLLSAGGVALVVVARRQPGTRRGGAAGR
jgi:hypothetical protein